MMPLVYFRCTEAGKVAVKVSTCALPVFLIGDFDARFAGDAEHPYRVGIYKEAVASHHHIR